MASSPTTKPPGSELLEGPDTTNGAGAGKEEETKPQVGFFEVFKYADCTDKALMIVGGLGAFVAGAGLPAFSEIFGRVVNTLLFEGVNSVEDAMSTLALYFVYVGLGMLVLSTLQVGCYMISAHRQVSRIKLLYFKSLLRQDIAWTDENKPGELTSRMDGDTTVLRNSINDKLSVGISALGTFIFGFGLGFYRSWELTLLMVGALPLIAVVSAIMGSIMEKMSKDTREGYANAGAIALEVFDNIKTVQTFGEEEHEVQRFKTAAEPAVGYGIKKDFAAATASGAVTCIMFIVYAIAFWFSSYLIEWKRNDVGEILSAFFSTLMASFSLGMVFPSVNAFMEGRAAAFRIFETIARKPPIDVYSDDEDASSTSPADTTRNPSQVNMTRLPSSKPLPTFERSIELNNISFAYPTRKDFKLFEGLNLTITKGQNVAFSGASGCGKSSIIQLLQRFYDVDGGEVLVDGVNLKEFSVKKWRDQIGIVSQEPNLFSGSITANVRVGKEGATQEEVEAACRSAQIHDLIMTLPDKYDTAVGQGGTSLSGGQKQRIAIARAIIRKPSILILDEATSALDRTSEIEVQAALENITSEGGGADEMFKSKMTVVSIAHRLSTIRNCDIIYFIAHDDVKGSWVEESGSYDELIAKDGQFAAMTRRQQIGRIAQEAEDEDEGIAVPSTTRVDANNHPGSPMLLTPGSATTKAPTDSSFSANPTALPLDTDPDTGALKQVTDAEIEEAVPSPYGRVLTMLKPDCWAVLVGIAGSIIQGVVYPAYSIIFTQMLDVLGRFANDGPGLRREVPLWAGLFIATGFTSLISWLMIGCYSIAGERLTLKIRERLFRAMLRQDMVFFDTPGRDTGSLAGMLAADTELVHALWGPSIGTKIQMFANVSGGVIIAFVYQWKVALVVLGGIPVLAISAGLQQALMLGTGSFKNKEGISDDTIKGESLTNIRTVTSFNMQKRCLEQYEDSVQQGHYRGVRDGIVLGVIFGFSQFSLYGIMALAFWFGGTLIAKGEADFLDVTVAAMSILMAGMGMGEVGGFATKFKDAGIASKRVFYVLDRTPKIDPLGMGAVPACNAEGARVNAELELVRFRYPSRPGAKVLSSVSMKIEDGKSYGLMGLTGCGKSTIIQLLARFYDPLRGRLLVGDAKEDMCEIGLVEWRKNLAIVLQEPALFSGTVMENIKYGGFVATQEEVYEVARLAQIHDDVVAMPNGYDTQVGYKGRALSGGQKQRVAIARALLRKPRLLLLDEATSALDNATESKVQQGILDAQAKHKMTIVAIAHRLTTIKDCDTIMVMHNGVVIESGSHEALIQQGGEYKKRWEAYEQQKSV